LADPLSVGSALYTFPRGLILRPREYRAYFHTKAKLSPGENGDGVWLLGPRGETLDGLEIAKTRWAEMAWRPSPNGGGSLLVGYLPARGDATTRRRICCGACSHERPSWREDGVRSIARSIAVGRSSSSGAYLWREGGVGGGAGA